MYMSLVIAKIAYNCTNLKMFLAKIYTNLKITAAPSLHCYSSGVNRIIFTLQLCKPARLPYFCWC